VAPLRAIGIAVLAAVAVLALLPQPFKGLLATYGVVHDLLHAAVFCAATLLTTWRIRNGWSAAAIGIGILAFGVLLEFLQTRVYGNWFEYRDVVTDAVGMVVGVAARRGARG
jgi:hypothetical protein